MNTKLDLGVFIKPENLTESLAADYSDTKDVIPAFQKLLTASLSLANRTQEAHWNIKGQNFGPLHSLFGDFYDFLIECSDTLAERIVQLDGQAFANPSGSPVSGEDTKLLSVIKTGAETLAKDMKDSIELCEKTDQVSTDILIETGRELEKWLWKIESNLK